MVGHEWGARFVDTVAGTLTGQRFTYYALLRRIPIRLNVAYNGGCRIHAVSEL